MKKSSPQIRLAIASPLVGGETIGPAYPGCCQLLAPAYWAVGTPPSGANPGGGANPCCCACGCIAAAATAGCATPPEAANCAGTVNCFLQTVHAIVCPAYCGTCSAVRL